MKQWCAFLPEIILLITALTCLLLSIHRYNHLLGWLSRLGISSAIVAAYLLWDQQGIYLNDQWMISPLIIFFKCFAYGLTLYMSCQSSIDWLKLTDGFYGEQTALMLLALVGMSSLMSASSLLIMFLALELMSLPIYALVAIARTANTTEAAIKYFMLGALSTGILLYGLSFLFGLTGEISFTQIHQQLATVPVHSPWMILVCVFSLIGFAFKWGLVPCHTWVADVYEGAKTPIALWIATATKCAYFVIFYRFFVGVLSGFHVIWQPLLLIFSLSSILIGHLFALRQIIYKRFLAYSSIAHMGTMMLGFMIISSQSYQIACFYLIIYILSTCVGFSILWYVKKYNQGECVLISDFRGLNHTYPAAALIMLILFCSMAGLPPFSGFLAKFLVLHNLIAHQSLWIAITVLILSAIGLYYYLNLIKVAYFDTKEQDGLLVLCNQSKSFNTCIWSFVVAIVLLGVFPNGLMSILNQLFS
ncbi:NADH-quinone oxidoreductase subunit N [Gammaproteobacteria bacterium]|nr:NADH-quinone oxidoreductase subunit N [Gammaproteobacteria bacterium]